MGLFAIDIGHNSPTGDTGAIGIKFEDNLTTELGNKINSLLVDMGHETVMCNPGRSSHVGGSLRGRCAIANQYPNADLYVSLHFNAFYQQSANGIEVWVYNMKSKAVPYAKRVLNNLCAELGLRNRGVKAGNFFVLKNTKMPAILIETAFLTSSHDMGKYNADKAARAIVEGILNQDIPEDTPEPQFPEKATLRVTINTVLKRETELAISLPDDMKTNIPMGDYEVTLLAEEEGHYLVRFDNTPQFSGDWFIFQKFCRII